MVHRDETDRVIAHALQFGVGNNVAGADRLDAGRAHAERGVGLDHRGRLVAARHEHEQ